MNRVVLAFAMSCVAALSPLQARASTASLIAGADALYARAADIVDDAPTTSTGASILANPAHSGGIFYAKERAFQDEVAKLPPTGELESQAAQVAVRLGQFDNFLYDSVVAAIASCNKANARINLKVAHELLEELHRVSVGRGHYDWNPPSLDAAGNVSDKDRCT